MYARSSLLREVVNCISAKINSSPVNVGWLTKDMVTDELTKLEDCIHSFPKSYYKKAANGSEYGEPIFEKLRLWKNILGDHHQAMLNSLFWWSSDHEKRRHRQRQQKGSA